MRTQPPLIKSHRAKANEFGMAAANCRDEHTVLALSRLAEVHGAIADALESGERERQAVFGSPSKAKARAL